MKKRRKKKAKQKALGKLGRLTQRKLIRVVQKKLEAKKPKDGTESTPHEDTILKYVKGDRLFTRTNPHELTIEEATWLAEHQPAKAKSLYEQGKLSNLIWESLTTAPRCSRIASTAQRRIAGTPLNIAPLVVWPLATSSLCQVCQFRVSHSRGAVHHRIS